MIDKEIGIKVSDVILYHKIDGEWEEYFAGNLDSPRGVNKIQTDNEIYLRIFPSLEIVEDNFSETKIEFSGGESDIIKSELKKQGNNVTVTKVWYNGDLKWEAYETERMFEVVK